MWRGAFPLFRVAGIQVYLHFTWFIIAALEVARFGQRYHAPIWGALEYIALFVIVLMHEFGHAFTCRQTGGQVDRIVLYGHSEESLRQTAAAEPGAYIWSLAAGPLVNAALFPVLTLFAFGAVHWHWRIVAPDLFQFVFSLARLSAFCFS